MENHIIFALYGELYSLSNKRCSHFDPLPLELLDLADSQIVISETAANCIAEQLSYTDIGKYVLNKRNFNTFLHSQGFNLTTSDLEADFPIFKAKLGADKPLKFELTYRDAEVKFGQDNVDLSIESMLSIRMLYDHDEPEYEKLNLETKELMYDEVPFLIAMDL